MSFRVASWCTNSESAGMLWMNKHSKSRQEPSREEDMAVEVLIVEEEGEMVDLGSTNLSWNAITVMN